MSTNIVNQVAYLRTTREFPEDLRQFTIEANKAYVDTANAVNNRTISIFPTTRSAINGESWFIINNQKQQGLRQVYAFTTTADIPIGFKFSKISRFVRTFGEYTDGTNWYGLIPSTSVAIAGQIGFYVLLDPTSTETDILRFVSGGGAPVLTNGTIVLEWLSNS